MIGSYTGTLVGFRSYDKDGKTKYIYDVFCTGRNKDPITGLYTDSCEIAAVFEDSAVIANPKYGMRVHFYGEPMTGKNGMFVRYSGIEAIENQG